MLSVFAAILYSDILQGVTSIWLGYFLFVYSSVTYSSFAYSHFTYFRPKSLILPTRLNMQLLWIEMH